MPCTTMLMACGWPKFMPISSDASSPEQRIVHLEVNQDLLLLVTSNIIELWNIYQHKVRIGNYARGISAIRDEGLNLQAVWRFDGGLVTILTSSFYLNFYEITMLEKTLSFSGEDSRQPSLVDLNLLSSIKVPLANKTVTSNLIGDNNSIFLGLSDGSIFWVSWSGQTMGNIIILDDGQPSVGTTMRKLNSSLISSYPLTILRLEISSPLGILVIVYNDGHVLQCAINRNTSGHVDNIMPRRWLNVLDAVYTAISPEQQLIAVGSRSGTVEIFNLADNATLVRTISLFDWGYSVEDTGAVNSICWTSDNSALAIGWQFRGLAVWSVSGCRLMCTIRQGSLSSAFSPRFSSSGQVKSELMGNGVAGLAWDEYAYNLFAVECGCVTRLVNFAFVKNSLGRCVTGSSNVMQLLYGEDRLLLIEFDEEEELKIQHLIVPQSYIGVSWPLMHVAINEDGSYLAMAGRQGLILYDVLLKRWRVFGDVTQERQIQCCGLLWLGKIIVVCNYREATKMYELNLYPRYHLDESSLLFRKQLMDKPIAIDAWQDYILVAFPPFNVHVLHVIIKGNISPFKPAVVELHTVRELSIICAKNPPIAMQLIPNFQHGVSSLEQNYGGERSALEYPSKSQPVRCMLLRSGGELSILDLDKGSECSLMSGIERFWLTSGHPKSTQFMEEVSWWAYGHQGMQVWYPSSLSDTSSKLDPEIDFDREVYPLALCPSAGVIIGVSQRLSVSACAGIPSFEPTPQAQTILPCLLRHLLQRARRDEALQLATLSMGSPHFAHSLEWLLFTAFDAAISSQNSGKKQPVDLLKESSLLQHVCNLIRHFPEYLDVVVSVARKTDGRHWPELFSAAGESTRLFEECFERKSYHTATCYILVIAKMEGPSASQRGALRLLQATLDESMYELAGELVQFLLRIGREFETAEKNTNQMPLASFFIRLPSSNSFAPKRSATSEGDRLTLTVRNILEEHAVKLMERKNLRELVAFVKETQFNLSNFLQREKDKSAKLEALPSALLTISEKLDMDVLQNRLDAEFLLAHMCTVGFREWIVVLATLLKRAEVLSDLFRGDMRLWKAYSMTLQSHRELMEFHSLLEEVEHNLDHSHGVSTLQS